MTLKITHPQMRAMLEGDEALLLGALERLVRAEHAEVVGGLPADLLRRMLQQGCTAARRYGLEAPADLAGFVMLMFEFGPQFDRHPAVQARLTDARLAPPERLQAVARETPDAVWREIAGTLVTQRWFAEA